MLAKTTGSKPVILFPDGTEKEINRRGGASILEGKKLAALASQLGAKVLVAEMMSIHPEAMKVESEKLIQAHIFVITNVRIDHIAQWGFSRERAARCFANSIPERSTVFIPQEEMLSVFKDTIAKRKAELREVPTEPNDSELLLKELTSGNEFEQNLRLSLAVADFLEIKRDFTFRGMEKASPDFGGLRTWQASLGSCRDDWYFISGFAANDPESTRMVLDKLLQKPILQKKKVIGILNLRKDRGDRTWHWLRVLNQGNFPELDRLVVTGEHAYVFKRKLRRCSEKLNLAVLKQMPPANLMDSLQEMEPEGAVVLGMGNMGGRGAALVRYWEQIGRPYVL